MTLHAHQSNAPDDDTARSNGEVVDHAVVRFLQRRVADRLTAERATRFTAGKPELDADDERQLTVWLIREEVTRHVAEQVQAGREPPAASMDERMAREIEAAIFGAGALQTLLDDLDVENIDINGPDEVWVTYGDERGKVRSAPVAASNDDLVDIVRALAAYAGPNARPFTAASPELDVRLHDGSRLSAVRNAGEQTVVSIRRNRYPQIFLAQVPAIAHGRTRSAPRRLRREDLNERSTAPTTLVQLGALDEQVAGFLEAAVRARLNIVVAGATDAGKTTLLRALIHCVPPDERLITVEKALEIGLRRHPHLHPDVVELETILPGADGSGGLSITSLVTRSLRMNPSRVIVGEVLGPEVVEMLMAMSQGNNGSLSTIHSNSAEDTFTRLALYARHNAGMDFRDTYTLIGSSLDLVVFVRKSPTMGGRRSVMEILEVTGSTENGVTRSRIFREGPDGRARRDLEVPIGRAGVLADHGYHDHITVADDDPWRSPRWGV